MGSIGNCQCKEFVEALEDGLDTPIYEGGKNFSGGQKQRLTIARALIAKPAILVLDDSLSALDYQTDLNLRTALNERLGETTLLVISQRISSIRHAQQILVLEEGRTVGLGTHDQLMHSSPQYQEIVHSQEDSDYDE